MKFFFLLVFGTLLLSSCQIHFGESVKGNGNIKNEQRDLRDFTGVEVSGPFQVMVQKGADYSISIAADENLLEYVEIQKEGKQLHIGAKDNFNLKPSKPVQVIVQLPAVSELSVTGSGLIKCPATMKSSNRIALAVSGSGKIEAEVDAPTTDVGITGSGTITLSGQTRDMGIDISGSGDCYSEALKSENCRVGITGSGSAKVYASSQLSVNIAGSGDVWYAGQPKINKSIAGSGKIKPL